MKLLYVNLASYEYVYLIVLIVHMFFLCWAKFQLLEKSVLFGHDMDQLYVTEPFAYKFALEISFTSSRMKTIRIIIIIPDFVYHMGAYTGLCHTLHTCTSSSTDII